MKTQSIKYSSVFKLAWPIFIQMILSMCLGYVDTAMMSRSSETAVGAIGNAHQIISFLNLAFSIIASATGVVVAQYLGAKKTSYVGRCKQLHENSMTFSFYRLCGYDFFASF